MDLVKLDCQSPLVLRDLKNSSISDEVYIVNNIIYPFFIFQLCMIFTTTVCIIFKYYL